MSDRLPQERLPRILFADDDAGLCDLIAAALSIGGPQYRLDFAHNGDDALFKYEAAITEEDPFDLCVLDVGMPVRSGLSAAEAIRAKGDNTTKIVFFTANNDGMTVERERTVHPTAVVQKPPTLPFGALAVLRKPDDVKELLTKVREALAHE